MPLGIFGGSSKDGGPKPQPLTCEESSLKREKNVGSSSNTPSEIKDTKGSTVKLNKKTYTVERKLAEGGFAIVYLVMDKHNRSYALKRQLIRDDQRQVEASRTESQIVKNLSGHKNIIEYVDHQLVLGKTGVYDYMLLTTYYPDNVLQLMNSRILVNKWLSQNEILDIFCDICEAVARLHHSKTPVIHRDLKVENVLIDRGPGKERPIYILCDFGSATTKVLSKEHYSHAFMEEEIQRYTTLSYRAPEMIDLFSGTPIDTKSDVWALGIMLYKLCYFSLPFGESALAIQGGLFSFPEVPQIQDGIKAMINLMLTMSAKHRPNIYQISHLAFSAAGKKCPVFNVEKCARIELNEAIQILHLRDKLGSNYSRLFEKAINDFEAQKRRHTMPNQMPAAVSKEENQTLSSTNNEIVNTNNQTPIISSKLIEGVIVNTKELTEMHPRSATTSVNPRLRPKPQAFSTPKQKTNSEAETSINSFVNKNKQISGNIKEESTSSQTFEQNEDEDLTSPRLQHLSAFQPYSLAQEEKKNSFKITENTARIFEISNPFAHQCSSSDFNNMDDKIFGEHFDAIRRDRVQDEDNLIFEGAKYSQRISNDLVTECGTSSKNTFSNFSKEVHRDWETIENRMGDDPFMNAPPILPILFNI